MELGADAIFHKVQSGYVNKLNLEGVYAYWTIFRTIPESIMINARINFWNTITLSYYTNYQAICI